MIVVHAHWIGAAHAREHGRLAVWAESSAEPPRRPRGRPRVPTHAFAASPAEVAEALAPVAPLPAGEDTAVERVVVWLPAAGNSPRPSPRLVHDWHALRPTGDAIVRPVAVAALTLAPADALAWLAALPGPAALPPTIAPADDLTFWAVAARFALELLAGQRYLPGLVQTSGGWEARWQPLLDGPTDAPRIAQLRRAMPPAARAAVAGPSDEPRGSEAILDGFLGAAIDAAVREWYGPSWRPRGGDDVAGRWLDALLAADATVRAPAFSLAGLAQAQAAWRRELQAGAGAGYRVCLRLGVPEAADDPWPLEILLQATDDPSLLVEARRVWAARGDAMLYLDHRFAHPQERLLTALGFAARVFPPLARALDTRRPTAVDLTAGEAHTFLREAVPLLEQGGFGVLVPPWWSRRGARLGARVRVAAGREPAAGASLLGRDSLAAYDWQLVVGDQPLSRAEFEALVRLKAPLVQVRGQWVALDASAVDAAIRFWERSREASDASLADILTWDLTGEGEAGGLPVEGVSADGWLGDVLARLRQDVPAEDVAPPAGLHAELRPYQQRGLGWLAFLRRWGLGACLADDMGLGKTVQAIALLLHERAESDERPAPALVVCPTSVAGNWQRELERFAPSLSVRLHHGPDRPAGDDLRQVATDHDVVITSYGLLRRDIDDLASITWSTLVLDEAQNLKNPASAQARAARDLRAGFRVALSGTPVENRLSELWSIMQVLNPGYLGSQRAFRSTFALPIERYHDAAAAERLRRLVRPFVLRRLKSDPAVIQDLPAKIEAKVYCTLTPEQATLYQAVLKEELEAIEAADEAGDAMGRRGQVLRLLLRLKQVCDHPALFLADGSALTGRSGKLARLTEMVEEVLAGGERALVFTQFSTMGEMLRAELQATFGREVIFLHGGTPRAQRERLLERFAAPAGPPLFILSLKAGGVGLNLTAASHVFHFDRWWNPAVEDQATDRAYRIGQKRTVQVHKLMVMGTLEERIDELIESKKALAASVVGDGEGSLTELSTAELREVVALRGEAVGDEP